jgi:hypothetical protein
MKKTWRLTPDQKHRIFYRYRKGDRVKLIAADFGICTRLVCRTAWARGAERRDKVHIMSRKTETIIERQHDGT